MVNNIKLAGILLGIATLLIGCSGIPSGVTVVQDFELDRYLGQWYEIARLDHSFERGLSHVTAEYAKRPDGRIDVLNRGYDPANDRWQDARGIAHSWKSRNWQPESELLWPILGRLPHHRIGQRRLSVRHGYQQHPRLFVDTGPHTDAG